MNANRPPAPRRGLRLLALVVAVICVLAVAAGAFVLSYPGARDMALTAGVSTQLARIYPWIFDAVVVVAAFAALSLRGVLRGWAWLAFLVAAGAIAFADAVHAASVTFPKEPTEVTVAAAPWAVLLIGFTLLYALARQVRQASAADPAADGQLASAPAQTAPVPLSTLLGERPNTRPERAQAALAAQALADPAPKRPAAAGTAEPDSRTNPVPAPDSPAEPQPVPDDGPETEAATAPEQAAALPATASPATTPPATASPAAAPPATASSATVSPAAAGTAATSPVAASQEPAKPESPRSAPTQPAATQPAPPPLPTRAATSTAEPTDGTSEFRSAQPSGGRDDPSDADAEPAEPTVHFNRLRSSPLPPSE